MGKSKQAKQGKFTKDSRSKNKHGQLSLVRPEDNDTYIPRAHKNKNTPVRALNERQQQYMDSIQKNLVTFGVGPAGTGKTWVCGALGCAGILSNRLDRLILTRPKGTVDEEWGEVPGDIDEKYKPYITPYLDVLEERMTPGQVEYFMRQKRIIALPLGLMRGMTFKHCMVILDEAQNATAGQLKMFLSRIGEGCTVVINGDPTQTDLPSGKRSGLRDAVDRFHRLPMFGTILFRKPDIVRHDIVQQIIEGYEQEEVTHHPDLYEQYGKY